LGKHFFKLCGGGGGAFFQSGAGQPEVVRGGGGAEYLNNIYPTSSFFLFLKMSCLRTFKIIYIKVLKLIKPWFFLV